MKYVVDEINLMVIEVPDDYIKCKVCRRWMPKSDYCDEHDAQVRTSCKVCSQLDHETAVDFQKMGNNFTAINWQIGKMRKLEQEWRALKNSITKEEYIARFNEAMAKIPDGAKVCMAEYETDNFGGSVEDYMEPNFDPIPKFDGKVWVI